MTEPPEEIDLRDARIEDVAEHAALVRRTEAFAALFESEDVLRDGIVINIDGALNDTLEPFSWQLLLDQEEAYNLYVQFRLIFAD